MVKNITNFTRKALLVLVALVMVVNTTNITVLAEISNTDNVESEIVVEQTNETTIESNTYEIEDNSAIETLSSDTLTVKFKHTADGEIQLLKVFPTLAEGTTINKVEIITNGIVATNEGSHYLLTIPTEKLSADNNYEIKITYTEGGVEKTSTYVQNLVPMFGLPGTGTKHDPFIIDVNYTGRVVLKGSSENELASIGIMTTLITEYIIDGMINGTNDAEGNSIDYTGVNLSYDSEYYQEYANDQIVIDVETFSEGALVFNEDFYLNIVDLSKVADEPLTDSGEGDLKPGDVSIVKTSTWKDATNGIADIDFSLQGASVTRGTDIIIVLDRSTSMPAYGSWDTAKESTSNLVNNLLSEENNRVGLVVFSGASSEANEATIHMDTMGSMPLTTNKEELINNINSLPSYGSTNYTNALKKVIEYADDNRGTGRALQVIFITDGEPGYTVGSGMYVSEEWNGINEAKILKDDYNAIINTVVIDVKNEIPDEVKAHVENNITTTDGLSLRLTDISELSAILNTVEDSISAAGTNAVLTDVISDEFEIDVARFPGGVIPDGVTIDGNTVTIDVGTIGDEKQVVTIPVKLKDLSTPHGIYKTNDSASLTYKDSLGNVVEKNDKTPVGNPDIESPTLGVNKGYISIKYYMVNQDGEFINDAGNVVTKEFASTFVNDFMFGTSKILDYLTYTVNGAEQLRNPELMIYTENTSYPSSYSVEVTAENNTHQVEFLVTENVAEIFNITYKNEDGTTIAGIGPNSYTTGTTTNLPTATEMNPLKPGYNFVGWTATNEDTDTTYITNVNSSETGEKTYYANYEKDASQWHYPSYLVEYYLDGILQSVDSKEVISDVEVLKTETQMSVDPIDVNKTYDNYSFTKYVINEMDLEVLPSTILDGETIEVHYTKTITTRPEGATVTAPAAGGVYNGLEHGLTVEGTVDGDTVWYLPEGETEWTTTPPTVTNVNQSKDVQVKVTNPAYEDVIINTSITVTPKNVTLTVPETTGKYEGVINYPTIDTSDLVNSTDLGELNVTIDGEYPEAAGTTNEKVTVEYTENPNYNVTVDKGPLTLSKGDRPEGGTITVTDPEATYDKNSHEIIINGKVEGDEVYYSTNGGETWIEGTPSITNVDENLDDVQIKVTNPKYEDVIVGGNTLTIKPINAIITLENTTVEFGTTPTFTVKTIEGVLEGDTLNEVAKYAEATVPTEVNVYTNKITADYSNSNYIVEVILGTLTITKSTGRPEGATVTAPAAGGVYNGLEHGLTVEGTVDGDTVWYLPEGETEWTTTPPTVTNVNQSKDVQVKVTNPAYEDVIINTSITVTPKNVTITMPENTTVDYGEDVVIEAPTVEGLVEGETLENVEATIKAGTDMNAGEKEDAITATYDKDPNYNVTVENGNLTINKGTINLETLTPKDPDLTEDEMDLDDTTYTKVYDGTELVFNEDNIKLTYNGEELTDVTIKYYKDEARTEEITLEEIKALNVEDTKEYFITISKENFEDIETSFVVSVTRRPVTITVEDSSVIEGNAFDEAKYLSMAQNAIANATTTAKGNAIINENDLGEVIASIEASLFNVVANNTDVAKLIFTVDGLEIIVENGTVNITINDNYEVTVNYGNLNVNKYVSPVTPTEPTTTPVPTVRPTVVPTVTPTVEPTPEATPESTIEPTTTPEIDKEDVIVKLDDLILDEDDFRIDEDGNIVLEQEFLDSLEDGEYVLSVDDGNGFIESDIIVDNEVPLFGSRDEGSAWSLYDLIVTIVSLIATVLYIVLNKKDDDGIEYTKKKLSLIIIALFTLVSIILFVVTQDLTAQMVIFDFYSIFFTIIIIAQALAMKFIRKYEEEETETN